MCLSLSDRHEKSYLQSDNDQNITMTIRGKTAEVLMRMHPALYRPDMWYSKKGVTMLYVLNNKAFYKVLRAATLFHHKLRADLRRDGI